MINDKNLVVFMFVFSICSHKLDMIKLLQNDFDMHTITLACVWDQNYNIFKTIWIPYQMLNNDSNVFLIKSFNWHCDYMILFSSSWLNIPNSEILLVGIRKS